MTLLFAYENFVFAVYSWLMFPIDGLCPNFKLKYNSHSTYLINWAFLGTILDCFFSWLELYVVAIRPQFESSPLYSHACRLKFLFISLHVEYEIARWKPDHSLSFTIIADWILFLLQQEYVEILAQSIEDIALSMETPITDDSDINNDTITESSC